jgi:hypothetical protein
MLTITSPSFPFRLVEAQESDSENLRVWKNAHRHSFFFKDEIMPEMQAKWFAKYKADKHSMMLIVQEPAGKDEWRSVGCMGYRLLTEDADAPYLDLFNILRGEESKVSGYRMKDAFEAMCTYLAQTYNLPQTCKVLTENPARSWYESIGLEKVQDHADHVDYRLNISRLNRPTIKVSL